MKLIAFNLTEWLPEWWQEIELEEIRNFLLEFLGPRFGILLICIILAVIIIAPLTPRIIYCFMEKSLPSAKYQEYKAFSDPFRRSFVWTVSLILINISLNALTLPAQRRENLNENIVNIYDKSFNIIDVIGDLAVTVSAAWLASNIAKQTLRIYGIALLKRVTQEVNDLILIFENTVNVIIGFLAAMIFAQTQNINLIAILTGLGIGGVAVAFAAQEALSQILATIVIYLDRPYLPGEYVRINFVAPQDDVYGRIESIGLRSTKLRISATNTLLVVPNSLMVSKDIENISRGTKIMVLFFLDFSRVLIESERALVEQVTKDSLNKEMFGLDPGSIQVVLFEPEDRPGTRVRISLFVMGSSEESIMLRKRLVEIANQSISKQLQAQGLQFDFAEPTIYVDSPVTL